MLELLIWCSGTVCENHVGAGRKRILKFVIIQGVSKLFEQNSGMGSPKPEQGKKS
jgi:hypothetical protein